MLTYLVKRLCLVLPTILVVLVLTFVLVRMSGSPADLQFYRYDTPQKRADFERLHGFDRPLVVQCAAYFSR
ncbi:MAG TPA: ABC transporter permease, partial [Planctomycetota bacterium]|nr:ABC transporter permease [Planctomycetota bacterium]